MRCGVVVVLVVGLVGLVGLGECVWPVPKFESEETFEVYLDDCFEIVCPSPSPFFSSSSFFSPTILEKTIARYQKLLFDHQGNLCEKHKEISSFSSSPSSFSSPSFAPSISLSSLVISYENSNQSNNNDNGYDLLDVDESYKLEFRHSYVELKASSIWGITRGLETFSQHIFFCFEKEHYFLPSFPLTTIDSPSFPHRGLLLDTSRHYYHLNSIFRMIEAMSYTKLNVLHWHIVDGQSFPLHSKKYQKLSEGAYSPFEKYSLKAVKRVIQFAKEHSIRVILEIDTPSHALSWGRGYPSVLPPYPLLNCPSVGDCGVTTESKCNVPLLPKLESIEMVEGLWKELVEGEEILEDLFIHMGGDEVHTECWGGEGEFDLTDFLTKINQVATKLKRHPILWDESFEMGDISTYDPNTVINLWRIPNTPFLLNEATKRGFRAIINTMMYLDWQDMPWTKIFNLEWIPSYPPLSNEQKNKILGGEVSVWSEKIDESNVDSVTWPRGAVAADLFWRNRESKQTITQQDAQYFLEDFKCVLNRRGVGASPVREEKEGPSVVAPSSCYRAFGEGGERVVRRGKVSSVGGRGGGVDWGGGQQQQQGQQQQKWRDCR